jgi:hypothetical protein
MIHEKPRVWTLEVSVGLESSSSIANQGYH